MNFYFRKRKYFVVFDRKKALIRLSQVITIVSFLVIRILSMELNIQEKNHELPF